MAFDAKKLINDPNSRRPFFTSMQFASSRPLRLSQFEHVQLSLLVAVADAVTECIEGLVETYPGSQYLDGFPEVDYADSRLSFICWLVYYSSSICHLFQVKVVLRADAAGGNYNKVAVISG